MLNLDTHVLLHALTGDLTRRESALLAHDTWSISAIVLWEIAKLARLGRIAIGRGSPRKVAVRLVAAARPLGSFAGAAPLVWASALCYGASMTPARSRSAMRSSE